jgi:hypothetical protein
MTIPFHPIAEIFPLMEGAEFEELVKDIKAKGLREPIILLNGQILDGRDRYRACLEAGNEPLFRDYLGDDPVGFVTSKGLRRKHFNESVRAMVAAKLATLRLGSNQHSEGLPIGRASELLNVGERSVARARTVISHGDPNLIKAVERGDVSVARVAENIRRGHTTGVGMCSYAERGNDLYQTPAPAVQALLEVEPLPPGRIWEPFAGKCAIANALRKRGHDVVATDLVDYGCGATGGIDFLQQESAPAGVELIVTNPAYRCAEASVRRALGLSGIRRVIMLLRFLFYAEQRRSDILENAGLARVHVFRNRLQIHREDWTGPQAAPQLALAWFVWDHKHRGPPVLNRISWKPEAPPPDSVRREPAP